MTDTTTTPTPTLAPGVVDDYVATWNEADPERRGELIARAWADEGTYVDPLAQATGHEALNTMISALRDQFPGHAVVRTSGVDAHHGLIRFGWHLTGADGNVAVEGIDVGIVAPDGRLARLAGFFGPLLPED
jgi:SnoaL-like domain